MRNYTDKDVGDYFFALYLVCIGVVLFLSISVVFRNIRIVDGQYREVLVQQTIPRSD